MSSIFKVNFQDVVQAVLVACVVAFLGGVQQMLTAHGFDFQAYDWSTVFNLVVMAFFGALGVKFGTTSQGKFLGVAKIS